MWIVSTQNVKPHFLRIKMSSDAVVTDALGFKIFYFFVCAFFIFTSLG